LPAFQPLERRLSVLRQRFLLGIEQTHGDVDLEAAGCRRIVAAHVPAKTEVVPREIGPIWPGRPIVVIRRLDVDKLQRFGRRRFEAGKGEDGDDNDADTWSASSVHARRLPHLRFDLELIHHHGRILVAPSGTWKNRGRPPESQISNLRFQIWDLKSFTDCCGAA
jgi:hypothetical protein